MGRFPPDIGAGRRILSAIGFRRHRVTATGTGWDVRVISPPEAAALLPFEVNLWQTQNMYWTMLQSRASDLRSKNGETSERRSWSEAVRLLGQLLFFNIPAVLAAAKGHL